MDYNLYKEFLENNKKYPRIGRVEYLSEKKLSTKNISPKKIIKIFEEKEPLSGFGEMILGESLINEGNIAGGINLIKKGWIRADLNKNELRTYKKKFNKYLKSEDHIKRADYLAWENKYWDLKRMLRYLPKDYQLLYTARQLLMSRSYGVDSAISNVPESLKKDAGLNYDRLKWRRKRGRVDSSLEILLSIKNNKDYMVRPDKWWVERSIIARSLIYKKRYEQAYKITSKHGLLEAAEPYLFAITTLIFLLIISFEIYNKKIKCQDDECDTEKECSTTTKKIKTNLILASILYTLNSSIFLSEVIL